jgi:hypothetical protein
MTQRDDAALKVSHDSSATNERESVTRPISSVREADQASTQEQPGECQGAPVAAAQNGEPGESELGRGDRPTLMGIAPVEVEGDPASGSHVAHEQTSGAPETSTVQPASWLASDAAQDDEPDADDDDDDDDGAEEPDDEGEALAAQEAEPDLPLPHSAAASNDGSAPVAEPPARAPMQISMFMPTPEHARLPEEGESEWLDLSTRWLVTSAPRAASEQPIADDNEVTDAYWAERLSARVPPRQETPSSAPPPPPQQPVQRASRPTIAYGRPSSPPSNTYASHGAHDSHAAPSSFDASGQRQWAPSPRRHNTLAGISPLPEDPNDWPRQAASEGARSSRPSGEPNPWREEPSYSDAPRPQPHAANHYAAPTGSMPPWAGQVPTYAMQPQAAMMPAYPQSSWNGAVTLPPPWAAQPTYGVAVQPLPPAAPYPRERRATRTMDYALPAAGSGSAGMRPGRAPQQPIANEISFEQWKGMANTWFMTVGKLALAGMALHFSGLAKPLLANFGYAPAQAASAESAAHASGPVGASMAAASVIPEGLSPEAAEEPASRRQQPKREPGATDSGEAPTRRSYKSAHKPKPKPKPARSAAAEAPAAAAAPPRVAAAPAAATPVAAAPQVERAPAPPVAAAAIATATAPESEEASGEALLRINSRPWSEIFVDGTHVGHTPKLDLRVSAGSHRIRLVNQDLGLSKTFDIDAIAGETVSHVELFID